MVIGYKEISLLSLYGQVNMDCLGQINPISLLCFGSVDCLGLGTGIEREGTSKLTKKRKHAMATE